ncbi:MAG: RagB/SusD family nutrient uptake outer membrane protein [Ferruginibacter sp.]
MYKFIKFVITTLIIAAAVNAASCKKYLEEKPDKKLVIPATLADLQALLDNNNIIVRADCYSDEVSADNYYLPETIWQNLAENDKRLHTWQKDFVFAPAFNDWSRLYTKIYYANTVLETIEKIEQTSTNKSAWDNIKGQALLVRAKALMQAVMIWCPAYDAISSATDMGLPIRVTTDFTKREQRATLQRTYDQITGDFALAIGLLPPTASHPARGSRVAAYSFLSRTFLAMRKYAEAKNYADSALQINRELLDYNSLSTTSNFPFPTFNKEMNYYTTAFITLLEFGYARVDSSLYKSYASDDCRKLVFFRINADGTPSFKGHYTGSNGGLFTGVSTNELYITRAECLARMGSLADAITDLNTLLIKRFKTGTFVPFSSSNAAGLLDKILTERRKELLFRGLRWMDLKRLNKEGNGIVLQRKLNNQTYTLQPNDKGYALPIPEDVISISGIQQNPR